MAFSEPNSNNGAHENPPDKGEHAVEMNTLNPSVALEEGSKDAAASSTATASQDMPQFTTPGSTTAQESTNPSSSATGLSTDPLSTQTAAPQTLESSSSAPAVPAGSSTTATQPDLLRTDTSGIGAADAITSPSVGTDTEPVCNLALLLTSGKRHPFLITEKYLAKRNVEAPGLREDGKKDPASISVYTLKELILRDWRAEWEAKPSSPSGIRLIKFGQLLDDSTALKGTVPRLLPTTFVTFILTYLSQIAGLMMTVAQTYFTSRSNRKMR
jgi:hypothetical protein